MWRRTTRTVGDETRAQSWAELEPASALTGGSEIFHTRLEPFWIPGCGCKATKSQWMFLWERRLKSLSCAEEFQLGWSYKTQHFGLNVVSLALMPAQVQYLRSCFQAKQRHHFSQLTVRLSGSAGLPLLVPGLCYRCPPLSSFLKLRS
jgi:hypothetical protein